MPNLEERDRFLVYLRRRGHRVTSERMALFDRIFAHHGHIDADELLTALHEDGVKISRATVYRNLDLLVECGLVHKHRLGRNRFHYEHVHAGLSHDHLVCAECGRVVEFISPGIAALGKEICRAHGFVPGRQALQITGLCVECAEREAAEGGVESDSAAAPPSASGRRERGVVEPAAGRN